MELIHKSIIQGGKVFQTVRAGFLQTLEEKDLGSWIEVLQQVAELSHGVAAGRYAQNVVNKTLNELLGHVLTRQVSFRKLSDRQELVERYRLCRKWD